MISILETYTLLRTLNFSITSTAPNDRININLKIMNISIFLIIQGFPDSEISFKLLLIYFNSSNYKFDDVEDYASLE